MNDNARDTKEWLETIRLDPSLPYAEAFARQIDRRDAIEHSTSSNALFLCEHPPTITLGRKSHADNLLKSRDALSAMSIDVVDVDRGGDVTYHGPGQMVAYPILNLAEWRRSISWYLRELEEVLIQVLDSYDLAGERIDGMTGVWVEGAKVAAVGVGIHNWVTYHGISLNVNTDMNHWALIVPCGIPNKPVTNLHQLCSDPPTLSEVSTRFEHIFRTRFGASRAHRLKAASS